MTRPLFLVRCTRFWHLFFLGVLFVHAPLAYAGRAVANTEPQARLLSVQKRLFGGGDYSAHFEQSYHDTLRAKVRHEAGTLEVKRDGRLRFVYDAPQDKQFVFDGNTAFFSEPGAGQVTVFPAFANTVAAQSMMVLWGQAPVGELFVASACTERCPTAQEGESVVALTPKNPIPTVRKVALVISLSEVCRACVYDPLGNVTEYRFSRANHDAKLEPGSFRFEIPKDVSVLYAPSGDPEPKRREVARQPDIRHTP